MEESGLTQHAIASLAEGIRKMMHMHEVVARDTQLGTSHLTNIHRNSLDCVRDMDGNAFSLVHGNAFSFVPGNAFPFVHGNALTFVHGNAVSFVHKFVLLFISLQFLLFSFVLLFNCDKQVQGKHEI